MSVQKNGDRIFQHVYREVFTLIVRISARIVGDIESAEGICQDAFLKLYERREQFPGPDDAKYWVIRVAKNLSINHAKRKERERRAYEKYRFLPKQEFDEADTQVIEKETMSEVQKALEALPEKLRTVLVLKEYGGLNYREIGKIMGITEGNVKVRVFRARAQLAQLFEKGDPHVS